MKILLQGKYTAQPTGNGEIFKCRSCHTVFEAASGEYRPAEDFWSVTSADCPQCGCMAFLHHLDTNERELIENAK